jgi:hypothetical protein
VAIQSHGVTGSTAQPSQPARGEVTMVLAGGRMVTGSLLPSQGGVAPKLLWCRWFRTVDQLMLGSAAEVGFESRRGSKRLLLA